MNEDTIKLSEKLTKENLKQVGSLFKKRLNILTETVVTNRIWLNSSQSSNCDVLIVFSPRCTYDNLFVLLDKILKSDLKVAVNYHQTSQCFCFYITASYSKLLKGADKLQLKKPIKSNFGGGMKEFIFDEQEFYENIEKQSLFLTTQEKQSIIYEFLNKITWNSDDGEIFINSIKLKTGRKLIHWCLHKKIISQIIPIHDSNDVKSLRKEWVFSLKKKQPLDKICEYFGVKLSLYFAWLGFYTRSLILPAVLGLAAWFNMGKDEFNDAILYFVLCCLNLLWAVGFGDLWKQRSAEFCYKWGTLDSEEDLLKDPRPLFKGPYKPSRVTGKLEPHYPEWKRICFRLFVTFPCLFMSICLTVAIMLLVFRFQDFVSMNIKNEKLPVLFGLTLFIPKMVYAQLIGGLNSFYKKLCTWLNEKENYREQITHENHLILKIILFQFINSYLSLFYIAFYLQDVPLLKAQLFAIFISKQLTGNFKESIIPYIRANIKQIKIISKVKNENIDASLEINKNWNQILEKLQHYADSYLNTQLNLLKDDKTVDVEFIKTSYHSDQGMTQPEVESLMAPHSDTFDDYLEMVMQFGLMVFFLPAFPLAALFSLINNVIEIRSDAFKMCFLYQRPFGQRVANIGIWQKVIEVFSVMAITVNCALLITYKVSEKLFPSLDHENSILLVIFIEHIFFALNKMLVYSLPNVPTWILIEKRKLDYRRRKALRQIETNEIHNLKNFNN